MKKIDTSDFNRLLGIWKTSGKISKDNQTLILNGTDSYELILDGKYILHKADVIMGSERGETFEIISVTNIENRAEIQYFNSTGESEITDNDFRINGEGIKFCGTINDKNSEIIGKWLLQTTDKNWKELIDLKLEK